MFIVHGPPPPHPKRNFEVGSIFYTWRGRKGPMRINMISFLLTVNFVLGFRPIYIILLNILFHRVKVFLQLPE